MKASILVVQLMAIVSGLMLSYYAEKPESPGFWFAIILLISTVFVTLRVAKAIDKDDNYGK